MKTTLYLLLFLLPGCKTETAEPGEMAGTITGYTIADNWANACSTEGPELQSNGNNYWVSNRVAPYFEEPNAWPIPVWVRFRMTSPDSCTRSENRIEVLSIRKR